MDQCLDSILSQTFDNFELLAINDGSTDLASSPLITRMEQESRIRLISPGRVGLVAALNLGLKSARSPLIARMDADDIMHPTRLEKQWNHLEKHPECALIASQVRLFPAALVKAGFLTYIEWQNNCLTSEDIQEEIYWESPLAHPSVMFRRSCVMALSGYRDGLFPEDYDLWLRMNQAGLRMEKLSEVLLDWREGADRLTRTDPRYRRSAFDRLRGHYLAQEPRLLSGRPLVIWGAGRPTRLRARHLMDRGFKPVAWIDVDPKKIGNQVWDIPVESPLWLQQEPKPFVLSYVTARGAREKNSQRLQKMGYYRGRDYLMIG